MEHRNRGRPKKETLKNKFIQIRVTEEEKEEIKAKAKRFKLSVSDLILYAIERLK